MTRWVLVVLFGGLAWFMTAPSALAAATCANIRCASGTCIDTPTGPTCQQRLTCASTLCAAGNKCIESASGPRCVPTSTWPGSQPRPPWTKPSPPVTNDCRMYRDSYRGQSYYRNNCHPRTQPTPPRYSPPRYTPPRTYPRYGSHNGHNNRWNNRNPYGQGHVHSQYCPPSHGYNPRPYPQPRPIPQPQPQPRPDMCPMHYSPVCAQKPVKCVRAPCPAVKQTFGNSCQASVAGYSVLHNGPCR